MFETFSSKGDSKVVTCPECGKQIKVTITYVHQKFTRDDYSTSEELRCGHSTRELSDRYEYRQEFV